VACVWRDWAEGRLRVGALAVIGENAVIGAGAWIGAGAVIGGRSGGGKRSARFIPGRCLYPGTSLGDRVGGAPLERSWGSDGFGYVRGRKGLGGMRSFLRWGHCALGMT